MHRLSTGVVAICCNGNANTLVDQPEKTKLEYRVIAVNKPGEGQASNTVMVVL